MPRLAASADAKHPKVPQTPTSTISRAWGGVRRISCQCHKKVGGRHFCDTGKARCLTGNQPRLIDVAGLCGDQLPRPRRGELPVQAATEFEMVLNLKTAKTLGITVPSTMLGRAAVINAIRAHLAEFGNVA